MQKHFSITLPQIPNTAKTIARQLRGGEVLALIGDLGSGKTTFTQKLAKLLKVNARVTSPTFVLMNVFPAVLPKNKKLATLLHLDLYRIKNFGEVKALDLEELWGREDVVTIIEWADKIKKYWAKNTWTIHFRHEKI